MKKKFLLIGILAAMLFGCLLAGCASSRSREGKIKVSYELEGGSYCNGNSVVQYYSYREGGKNLIREIGKDSQKEPERAGYDLEGWYLSRTEQNGEVTYSDKWDFEADELKGEPITLYARWVKQIKFTFELHYFDDNNEDITLPQSVGVNAGDTFRKKLDLAKSYAARTGYTFFAWVNEDGTPFDLDTAHPGGEESLAIPVYVQYIKGIYSIVSTAEELKGAVAQNIYLTADIDMGGEEFSFGDYRMKTLQGNHHKIYNFKLKCLFDKNGLFEDYTDSSAKSVGASLFGSAYKSTVTDVEFEFTVEIKTTYKSISGNIYLAALALAPKEATFRNVKVNAEYEVKALPQGFADNRVKVEETKGYSQEDSKSTFEEVQVSLKEKKKEKENEET